MENISFEIYVYTNSVTSQLFDHNQAEQIMQENQA